MFSRTGFLLSPLGTMLKLMFLGVSHGDLKPLSAAIERSRPKAIVRRLLLEDASDEAKGASEAGQCRTQPVVRHLGGSPWRYKQVHLTDDPRRRALQVRRRSMERQAFDSDALRVPGEKDLPA